MLRSSNSAPQRNSRNENEGLIVLQDEDASILIPPISQPTSETSHTRGRDTELSLQQIENQNSFGEDETNQIHEQVLKGLMRIKEFDMLLKEKNATARALKKERIQRESQTGTPITGRSTPSSISYHNTLSDDDDDDEKLELRSIKSEDSHIFITEPKFSRISKEAKEIVRDTARIIVGKQALGKNTKQSSYKQGDFIGRNIALGADARFWHALTEDEKKRVELLVKEDALDEIDGQRVSAEIPDLLSGFVYKRQEKETLDKIDSQLCLMTVQSEWETKSIIHSSQHPSGIQTPLAGATRSESWNHSSVSSFSLTGTIRGLLLQYFNLLDIDEALHDKAIMDSSIFNEYTSKVKEIDEKLADLNEQNVGPTIDHEQIKDLIQTLIDMDQALSLQTGQYPEGPAVL